MKPMFNPSLLGALLGVAFTAALYAQGTAINYQGSLKQSGTVVDGPCDFSVSLWDAQSNGNAVGSTVTSLNTPVTGGLFVLNLDFGTNVFDGSPRWIEISVRHPAGSGNYTALTPRQPITPAPVAHFALAGNEGPQGPTGPQGPQGPAGDSYWTEAGATLYNTDRYVGIGTVPNVSARLDVDGTGAQAAISAVSSYVAPTITAENSGSGPALQLFSVNEAGFFSGGALQIGYNEQLNLGIDRNEIIARGGGVPSPLYLNYDASQPTGPVVIGDDLKVIGNVGIGLGTDDPTSKLDIVDSGGAHALEAESDHAVFPTIYARNAANGPVLWAESSEDVSLTNITSGTIVAGSPTGPNVAIDNNEIMARDNGATTTLYLNADGGEVRMGEYRIPPALAFGKSDQFGFVRSASANVVSVVVVGVGHYEVRIDGGFTDDDIPIASVRQYGNSISAYIYTEGLGDPLVIRTYDEDGDPEDSWFSFVVYRP